MTEAPVSSVRVGRAVTFLRALYDEVKESNVPFMAASIAYYAFVSLLPLLVLAFMLATVVGGELLADYVVRLTASYLSPTGQQLLVESLTRASGRVELSLATLAVFLWATLRVFRGLDVAFSVLYDTHGSGGVLDQLLDGVVVLVALGLAIAGSVAVFVLVSALPTLPFSGIVDKVLLVAFLTVVFLPMYYFFPDADLSVGEVLPGAVVGAVGWTALQMGFRVYVNMSGQMELYGVIGGIILLVTWLYFGALVVLLGATVNVVVRRRP